MRRLMTIHAVLGLFLGLVYNATAVEFKPVWTVENLAGKAIAHSGADCHNATLVGKGYEDNVYMVTAPHMEFYLKKFCSPRAGAAQAGDIVAVTSQYGLDHTFLMLENGKIFEKESGDGLLHNISKMNPHFQVKRYEESFYYVNREKNGLTLTAYECKSAKEVRAEMRSCEERGREAGIQAVKEEFEKMAFAVTPEFTLGDSALESMKSFAHTIENTYSDDPCRDYFFAVAHSLEHYGLMLNSINAKLASPAWLAFAKRQEWLQAMSDVGTAVAIAESDPRLQR